MWETGRILNCGWKVPEDARREGVDNIKTNPRET
jgi:hypothetical protein